MPLKTLSAHGRVLRLSQSSLGSRQLDRRPGWGVWACPKWAC